MFALTTAAEFTAAIAVAQDADERIAAATTPAADLDLTGAACFLSRDGLSGFVVKADGELVSVFSLVGRRGDAIVEAAIANGASHLDCFDGYLPTFYARHGFIVTARVANWTEGGPDVVFMALAHAA
jgi:hypothetical protein